MRMRSYGELGARVGEVRQEKREARSLGDGVVEPEVMRAERGEPVRARRRLWLLALALGLVVVAGLCASKRGLLGSHAARSKPTAPAPARDNLEIRVLADLEPADGALVTIRGENVFNQLRSEADGGVHLAAVPPVALQASVEFPGYARAVVAIEAGSGTRRAQIELVPGAALRGRIHDESDRPIAGASVLVRVLGPSDPASREPWSATSDAEGRFSIESLPRGRVTVDVSDDGAHEPASLAELQLPAPAEIEIALQRMAAVSGHVLFESQPVAAAEVRLAGSGVWPARRTQSDAQGEFRFDGLPEGVYEVRAEQAERVSNPVEGIGLQPGNHAAVELTLVPALTLNGVVRDAVSGQPLAAAQLEVVEQALSALPKQARSDELGRFAVAGLRAVSHQVTVHATGYVVLQSWVSPGPPDFNAELLRAFALSGRVEDSEGLPIAGAELEVSGRSLTGETVRLFGSLAEPSIGPERSAGAGDNLGVTAAVPRVPIAANGGQPRPALLGSGELRSDATGRFRLDGLPAGELLVTARKSGFASGRSQQLQIRAGEDLPELLIVLPRGATIVGRTVDAHGLAVAHIRVDLKSPGEPSRSTVSGEDGSFHFDGARGDCSLVARPLGAPAAQLTIPGRELGSHEVELVLEGTSERLAGRVLDAHGAPIESATVHLTTGRGRSFEATTLSGNDGTFDFAALPDPPYDLKIEHPEYAPSTLRDVLDPRRPLIVRLEAGADLSGIVQTLAADRPIKGARVSVSAANQERAAVTSPDGAFRFRHLPLGRYELTIDADGYVPERRTGVVAPSWTDQMQRIALAEVGGISGDVVDRLGATVWNAEVTTGQPPAWERAVRTNHAGHFSLDRLPAGDHIVSARHGELSIQAGAAVRVRPGQDNPGLVLRLAGVVDEPADRPTPSRMRTPSIEFSAFGGNIVIERVDPGSAGERAGLRAGDVLLRVDDEPVRSAAQARGMLASVLGRPRSWSLELRRAGTPLRVRYGTAP
jgi:hypothetical protein